MTTAAKQIVDRNPLTCGQLPLAGALLCGAYIYNLIDVMI